MTWSPAFLEPREAGLPIDFTLSGRAWSDRLAGVERWQLDGDGTLELLAGGGSVSFRFRPRAGFFFAHSIGEGLPTEQVVWIGTAGSDFEATSTSPPGPVWEELEEQRIGTAPAYFDLRAPVPEVVEHFAGHGIRLERNYLAAERTTEYRVVEPATTGFRVKVRIWRFPTDWTENEIQDYLLPYSLGSPGTSAPILPTPCHTPAVSRAFRATQRAPAGRRSVTARAPTAGGPCLSARRGRGGPWSVPRSRPR